MCINKIKCSNSIGRHYTTKRTIKNEDYIVY